MMGSITAARRAGTHDASAATNTSATHTAAYVAQQLKRQSGKRLEVWGVKLPLALAELGLIDEYELVIHPRIEGRGPTLFAGLSKHLDLRLVSRHELASGAVEMRYEANSRA